MITIDKKKIEQDLQRYRRKRVLFLVLAIVFFTIWGGCEVTGLILLYNQQISEEAYFFLTLIGEMIGVAGIMLIFLRSFVYGRRVKILEAVLSGKDVYVPQPDGTSVRYSSVKEEAPIVDAIDPQKANLVHQYEELLKQGLITHEDFERRKEEIMK